MPVLVEPEAGEQGRLRFHLAAANPLVQALRQPHEAVAISSGPHAYILPDFYQSPNMVPTWNYVAVHAHGCAQELDWQGLAGWMRDGLD